MDPAQPARRATGSARDRKPAGGPSRLRKSCDPCSLAKRRCDGLPECSLCVKKGLRCIYGERQKSGPKGRKGPAPLQGSTNARRRAPFVPARENRGLTPEDNSSPPRKRTRPVTAAHHGSAGSESSYEGDSERGTSRREVADRGVPDLSEQGNMDAAFRRGAASEELSSPSSWDLHQRFTAKDEDAGNGRSAAPAPGSGSSQNPKTESLGRGPVDIKMLALHSTKPVDERNHQQEGEEDCGVVEDENNRRGPEHEAERSDYRTYPTKLKRPPGGVWDRRPRHEIETQQCQEQHQQEQQHARQNGASPRMIRREDDADGGPGGGSSNAPSGSDPPSPEGNANSRRAVSGTDDSSPPQRQAWPQRRAISPSHVSRADLRGSGVPSAPGYINRDSGTSTSDGLWRSPVGWQPRRRDAALGTAGEGGGVGGPAPTQSPAHARSSSVGSAGVPNDVAPRGSSSKGSSGKPGASHYRPGAPPRSVPSSSRTSGEGGASGDAMQSSSPEDPEESSHMESERYGRRVRFGADGAVSGPSNRRDIHPTSATIRDPGAYWDYGARTPGGSGGRWSDTVEYWPSEGAYHHRWDPRMDTEHRDEEGRAWPVDRGARDDVREPGRAINARRHFVPWPIDKLEAMEGLGAGRAGEDKSMWTWIARAMMSSVAEAKQQWAVYRDMVLQERWSAGGRGAVIPSRDRGPHWPGPVPPPSTGAGGVPPPSLQSSWSSGGSHLGWRLRGEAPPSYGGIDGSTRPVVSRGAADLDLYGEGPVYGGPSGRPPAVAGQCAYCGVWWQTNSPQAAAAIHAGHWCCPPCESETGRRPGPHPRHWEDEEGHIAVARADLGHHPCYGAGGYEPRGPARRQAWIDRGAPPSHARGRGTSSDWEDEMAAAADAAAQAAAAQAAGTSSLRGVPHSSSGAGEDMSVQEAAEALSMSGGNSGRRYSRSTGDGGNGSASDRGPRPDRRASPGSVGKVLCIERGNDDDGALATREAGSGATEDSRETGKGSNSMEGSDKPSNGGGGVGAGGANRTCGTVGTDGYPGSSGKVGQSGSKHGQHIVQDDQGDKAERFASHRQHLQRQQQANQQQFSPDDADDKNSTSKPTNAPTKNNTGGGDGKGSNGGSPTAGSSTKKDGGDRGDSSDERNSSRTPTPTQIVKISSSRPVKNEEDNHGERSGDRPRRDRDSRERDVRDVHPGVDRDANPRAPGGSGISSGRETSERGTRGYQPRSSGSSRAHISHETMEALVEEMFARQSAERAGDKGTRGAHLPGYVERTGLGPDQSKSWTEEEDDKLFAALESVKDAIRNKVSTDMDEDDAEDSRKPYRPDPEWTAVARTLDGRSAAECRARWRKITIRSAPSSRESPPWTPEEEAILVHKYRQSGPQWDEIAKIFPNRTEADVRRYLTNPGDRSEESYVRRYDEDANSFPEGVSRGPTRFVSESGSEHESRRKIEKTAPRRPSPNMEGYGPSIRSHPTRAFRPSTTPAGIHSQSDRFAGSKPEIPLEDDEHGMSHEGSFSIRSRLLPRGAFDGPSTTPASRRRGSPDMMSPVSSGGRGEGPGVPLRLGSSSWHQGKRALLGPHTLPAVPATRAWGAGMPTAMLARGGRGGPGRYFCSGTPRLDGLGRRPPGPGEAGGDFTVIGRGNAKELHQEQQDEPGTWYGGRTGDGRDEIGSGGGPGSSKRYPGDVHEDRNERIPAASGNVAGPGAGWRGRCERAEFVDCDLGLTERDVGRERESATRPALVPQTPGKKGGSGDHSEHHPRSRNAYGDAGGSWGRDTVHSREKTRVSGTPSPTVVSALPRGRPDARAGNGNAGGGPSGRNLNRDVEEDGSSKSWEASGESASGSAAVNPKKRAHSDVSAPHASSAPEGPAHVSGGSAKKGEDDSAEKGGGRHSHGNLVSASSVNGKVVAKGNTGSNEGTGTNISSSSDASGPRSTHRVEGWESHRISSSSNTGGVGGTDAGRGPKRVCTGNASAGTSPS